MSGAPSIRLDEIMATKSGSVDPFKFPDEVFDLYSIPAFDHGEPEVVVGKAIGSAKQIVEPRDVLLSKIVPHIRRSWVVGANRGRRIIASGEWIVFRSDRIHPGYLRHVLVSDPFHAQFMSTVSGVGGSLLRARPAHVARISIPLPPLPEQRRIAEILNKADAMRAKRRAALAQLDILTQSIFLDMFGDPATNPKGWPVRTLGELFEICSSKRVLESQWKRKGIPFYRAREIVKLAKQGHVDNDIFISEELFNELSGDSGAPQAGDLMVSAVGTLGACYQVRDGDRFYFKDASVPRFIPQGEVEPAFVRHAFSTDHVRRQVHGGSGSTVGTYTIARARQTRLYLPPLALQRRFSLLVQCVQSQSELQTTALNESDRLFVSLQHRAFRGEL